jgi:hypothetical protein
VRRGKKVVPPAPPNSLKAAEHGFGGDGSQDGDDADGDSYDAEDGEDNDDGADRQDGNGSTAAEFAANRADALPLLRFLDGMHCFDEICSEVGMSVKMVEEKIRGLGGELEVIWK